MHSLYYLHGYGTVLVTLTKILLISDISLTENPQRA